MGKIVTLKLNKEFRRAYGRGRSVAHPLLVTYVVKNRLGITRLGITTSRKIGKAVQRNRARRIIRQAYREVAAQLPVGYDIVLVARTRTVQAKSTQLAPVLAAHLKKLGLLPSAAQKR